MNDEEYIQRVEGFIAHHGTKGMKWGVHKDDKTGSTELTAQERKILKTFDPDGSNSKRLKMMYGSDSDGSVQKKSSDISPEVSKTGRLTPGQKKALKIGAGVAIAGLATYGLYKYGNNLLKKQNSELSKSSLQDFLKKQDNVIFGRRSGFSKDFVKNLSSEPYHFPAGSIVQRVVTRERFDVKSGGFYAAYKKEDIERYKAVMPIYWKQWGYGDSTTEGYVASLRAKVDIRAPSQTDTLKIFKGMLDDDFGHDVSGSNREFLQQRYSIRNVSDDELIRRTFPQVAFNWAQENDTLTKSFFTRLRSQGFNAVSDLNDAGALSDSPMRFLDGKMFEVAGHERLTRSNIDEAQKNILQLVHAMSLSYFTMLSMQKEESERKVEDFLVHFGTKGMHWGVRKNRESRTDRKFRNESQKSFRYAQLPELKTRLGQSLNRKGMSKEEYASLGTKEVTIKTGKTLRRVTRNPNNDAGGSGNLFVSRTRKDAEVYRGVMPSSKFLGSYRRPSEGYHEITMKVIKELKSPSEKERVDTFVRLMDESKIKLTNGTTINGRQWLTESGYGHQVKKLSSLDLGLKYYQKFTKDNGLQNSPINSAYFKSLKKKGYNALIDDNDRNIVSKEPWLVIDSKGTLKNLKVKPLSTNDILKAQKNLKFPDASVEHFGTKGMHWGIRNDRDRSTESRGERKESSKTLNAYMYKMVKDEPRFMTMTKADYTALSRKGETFAVNTTIRRISMGPSAQVKGALFVSRLQEDSAYYRGAFPAIGPLAGKKGGGKKTYKQPSYEMEYQTVKKLSSPSEKVRVDTYLKLLDTPSIKLKGKHAPITGREFLENNALHPVLKKYETQELGFRTWHEFVRTQGNRENPLAIAYFDKLKSKGYNALPDDNDRRLVTKAPLILLNPESTLKIGSVRRLTTDEINRAQRQLGRHIPTDEGK